MSPAPPAWIIALPFLWIGGLIALSILFRIRRGKPIFPKVPSGAVYSERWTSGCNISSTWSIFNRLGGAQNCLLVVVTRDHLIIAPHFPFNLIFLPEIYGLERSIPLNDITSVEPKQILLMKRAVVRVRDGLWFELRIRDLDAFKAALGKT